MERMICLLFSLYLSDTESESADADTKPEPEEESEGEQHESENPSVVTESERVVEWLCDSGASDHMSSSTSDFSSLDVTMSGHVEITNGLCIPHRGVGTVNCSVSTD